MLVLCCRFNQGLSGSGSSALVFARDYLSVTCPVCCRQPLLANFMGGAAVVLLLGFWGMDWDYSVSRLDSYQSTLTMKLVAVVTWQMVRFLLTLGLCLQICFSIAIILQLGLLIWIQFQFLGLHLRSFFSVSVHSDIFYTFLILAHLFFSMIYNISCLWFSEVEARVGRTDRFVIIVTLITTG